MRARSMAPARKRAVRLVVALSAALLLAGALAWTSFSASSEARTPAPPAHAAAGARAPPAGTGARLAPASAARWPSSRAAPEPRPPAQLAHAAAGERYQLTGKVADGTYVRKG